MAEEKNIVMNETIERMFKAGAHFGYSKSRRHPSVKPLIFGAKNKVEIFDLEKTKEYLDTAKAFVASIAKFNGVILFLGGKNESRDVVRNLATSIGMPYVAGRWIGGTFTNFPQIKKRTERLEMLVSQKEKGELSKYTKKERLLIDREIDTLNRFFLGIINMKEMPKALFVVDSKREHIAVTEAHKAKIPVIALVGSDCNIKEVEYPIPGNDTSVASITFFLSELINAYKDGRKA
ncbi:MAG: 30S ribosomal protein S2 [bacterium]|nr:30S ribosomal protein S2 [bacterium]